MNTDIPRVMSATDSSSTFIDAHSARAAEGAPAGRGGARRGAAVQNLGAQACVFSTCLGLIFGADFISAVGLLRKLLQNASANGVHSNFSLVDM